MGNEGEQSYSDTNIFSSSKNNAEYSYKQGKLLFVQIFSFQGNLIDIYNNRTSEGSATLGKDIDPTGYYY